ncbi:MAG: type II toxin-antitoxin system VapC family toxin [Flammeovirgaceae bacterium]
MEKGLVLCDTNIIIEFYKENPVVVKNLQGIGQQNIAVSIVTAGELLYGALNKKELNQIKNDLEHLHVIHLKKETGERFTQLMVDYTLSHRLSLPDGLIAATALTEDLQLYTHNLKDFRYIKGIGLYKEK